MLAILLSAGKGRRVGVPKAFLELDGRTAYQRCVEALAACGLPRIRVVVSPEGAQRLPASQPPGSTVELVVNEAPDRGQTSSLRRALQGVSEDFLLHTVDHPLVRPGDIGRLLAAWERRDPATDIVAPSVGGRRGHPCLYSASLVDEFLALDDDTPAHTIIRAQGHRVEHVVLEDPWIVRDIDLPADVEAALSELAVRNPG
jgi:molybdenum cofactor cytidylyltransferase